MLGFTKTEKGLLIYLLAQQDHRTEKSITQISIELDKSLVSAYKASAHLQALGLIERKQIVIEIDGKLKRRQITGLTAQGIERALIW